VKEIKSNLIGASERKSQENHKWRFPIESKLISGKNVPGKNKNLEFAPLN